MSEFRLLKDAVRIALSARPYTYLNHKLTVEESERTEPFSRVPEGMSFREYLLHYDPITQFTPRHLKTLTSILHSNPYVGRDMREFTALLMANFYTKTITLTAVCDIMGQALTLHSTHNGVEDKSSLPKERVQEMSSVGTLVEILKADKQLFACAALMLCIEVIPEPTP